MSRPLQRGVSGGGRFSGNNHDFWDDSQKKDKTDKENLDKIGSSDHTLISFKFPIRLSFPDNSASIHSPSENGFASDPYSPGTLRSRHKLTLLFIKLGLVAIVVLALIGSFLWTMSITISSRVHIFGGYKSIQAQIVSDLWDIGELSVGSTRLKELEFCPLESENYVPCFNATENLALGFSEGEEYDRHCTHGFRQNCLVLPPVNYKIPLRWPTGKDVIWVANVKITAQEVLSSGSLTKRMMMLEEEQISFRSASLMFDGVEDYSHQIAEMIGLRNESNFLQAGVRIILDIGCGYGSFGAHLFSKQLLTMCIANYEASGSQVQLTLERGLPAMLGSFTSKQLPYPSLSFDMVHCARCGIDWDKKEGILLIEADRVLRPGGYFVWTSPLTNVQGSRRNKENQKRWNFVRSFAEMLCWDMLPQQDETVVWTRPSILSLLSILVLYVSSCVAAGSDSDPPNTFLQCLSHNSQPSAPISSIIYTPNNSSYPHVLQSYIRNLRFISSTTPKPLFIIAPTHVSHIQASIICSEVHSLQLRIRSGGHDYDGLSYVSDVPFVILDMFNLRTITIDLENEKTAWVDSGATLGELYYEIAKHSKIYGFPAGVCPTVGVGGHFSGGGYGNMMRKYGLSVDNVIDARIVDANGRILDKESMGEDLFWAIRGGGGASFGVIVSWKIKLVLVPERVTVFKVERTLEQDATNIVYKWQYIADKIHNDLFIRVVVLPSTIKKDQKNRKTIKAKFVSLFLGNADSLFNLVNEKFPELGLQRQDCLEMSWIESVLFWSNYANGTSVDVLLDRMPQSEKFLKKKSDYVQNPISKEYLEGIWKTMIELKKPALTFNPYGGKMSEISEFETPFPHRSGNMFKIQYSVTWKEEDAEAADHNLNSIRRLYDYMTPYVSKSPRGSYLNYRDIDLGTNQIGHSSYSQARIWGTKYFKSNFDRLVYVKSVVDPEDFFRYEQSIPSVATWKNGNTKSAM